MKILYVFTGGRRQRLERVLAGEDAPREFLFGVPYLLENGYKVDIIELTDLKPDKKSIGYRLRQKKNNLAAKITRLSSCSHFFDTTIVAGFNNYDLVVAGNEYVALGLSSFKKRNILKRPLVFFVMGMLAKLDGMRFSPLRYRLSKGRYEQLLRNTQKCFFLGSGEYEYAYNCFADLKENFEFLPYPVDTDFWWPDESPQQGKYILFIGNDRNRDYDLALQIAEEMKEYQFKFITKRIPSDKVSENTQLISGDWKESILSDMEVREIIRGSSVVILPLKESLQPSGQSVCQQVMSCGKTAIITRTEGFWSPDDFVDKKHLCFVETNHVHDWCKLIIEIIHNDAKAQCIGMNARKFITEKYNIRIFGEKLERIISQTLKEYSK